MRATTSLTQAVIASGAKQSKGSKQYYLPWIAAAPSVPRNDDGEFAFLFSRTKP